MTSPPLTTSGLAPARRAPVGAAAHDRGVRLLRESYRAIPADQQVRLAKRTSNLFRPRGAAPPAGLDVSGLGGVIGVDAAAGTADVQGMCTYEDLVATTLGYGLMPLVVPQLRTITLGGAVTGLGIESTSFRNGLPHESVTELDVLTGDGELVTARPDGAHADLFAGFCNSYGTLGYATRLRIELEPVRAVVGLHHLRFGDLDELCAAAGRICEQRSWDGEPVDFLDGMVVGEREAYLTLGRMVDDAQQLGDYTGQQIYYRSIPASIPHGGRDALTIHDYLWRWDTDWFWCSAAFGAQRPIVRRVWPARYRRSDVYHRIIGWENRHHGYARLQRARGRPERERVIQDVELPLPACAEFLRWFLREVRMTPVWICPLRLRHPAAAGDRPWPLYPLRSGTTYLNIGFWGTVPIADGARDGDVNRAVERQVGESGGHKSLYSDAYYSAEEFAAAYGGSAYRSLKSRYDPGGRLPELYDKVVGRR